MDQIDECQRNRLQMELYLLYAIDNPAVNPGFWAPFGDKELKTGCIVKDGNSMLYQIKVYHEIKLSAT